MESCEQSEHYGFIHERMKPRKQRQELKGLQKNGCRMVYPNPFFLCKDSVGFITPSISQSPQNDFIFRKEKKRRV